MAKTARKGKSKRFWNDYYEGLGETLADHKEELAALEDAEKSGKVRKGSMDWFKKELKSEIKRLEKKRLGIRGLV